MTEQDKKNRKSLLQSAQTTSGSNAELRVTIYEIPASMQRRIEDGLKRGPAAADRK